MGSQISQSSKSSQVILKLRSPRRSHGGSAVQPTVPSVALGAASHPITFAYDRLSALEALSAAECPAKALARVVIQRRVDPVTALHFLEKRHG